MTKDNLLISKLEKTWYDQLLQEFDKQYYHSLSEYVRNEYMHQIVYPKPEEIFRAFELCRFDDTKVVILGQDPYHSENQAHGLSFSVPNHMPLPPSLKNIFKAIGSDLQLSPPSQGDLSHWAEQGVLLLNATLTVRANEAGSHQKQGWEQFTDAVIQSLSSHHKNIVFILWGAYAIKKKKLIDSNKHLILTSVHPSPLSAYRGFFENKHFSKANKYLIQNGKEPIKWC